MEPLHSACLRTPLSLSLRLPLSPPRHITARMHTLMPYILFHYYPQNTCVDRRIQDSKEPNAQLSISTKHQRPHSSFCWIGVIYTVKSTKEMMTHPAIIHGTSSVQLWVISPKPDSSVCTATVPPKDNTNRPSRATRLLLSENASSHRPSLERTACSWVELVHELFASVTNYNRSPTLRTAQGRLPANVSNVIKFSLAA